MTGRRRGGVLVLAALVGALVLPAATARAQGGAGDAQLRTLRQQARDLRKAGKLDEARRGFEEALALARKLQGENGLATAGVLTELGMLNWQAGEYARAEPLVRRGLEIREARLGKDHL